MVKKNSRYYADILPAPKGGDASDGNKKLIDRAERLKDRYENRDSVLDEVERYYYDTGVQKSKDGEIYHVAVNDAQSAIDLMADLLSGQDVKVTVPAMSESVKAKSDANDSERWLEAWFRMTEREEDVRLVHEMAQDIIMRGAAVMRVLMLDERLPKKDDDKKMMGDFPLVPEVRDYRFCYPVYKRTKLVEVFECYEAKAGDIRLDWEDLDVPKDWKDDEEVMVWEWWSEKKKAFWVTGTSYVGESGISQNEMWLMKPTAHGYGVLPYSIRAMRPQTKKRNDPSKMAPSLLQSWSGVLDALNLIESAKFTAGMSYINSAWVVYTNRKFDLDLTHGAVNYLNPDNNEKIEPLTKSDMPVDLMQIGGDWTEKFQRASVPGALYGDDIGPNMAGYAIALLNESGRRILIPITTAIEGCLSDCCGIALAVSENLLGPTLENLGHKMEIYVTHKDDTKRMVRRGVTLDWAKIDSMYMVEVGLGDPMPQDDERNMNMAIAARQPNAAGMPLLSDETIRMDVLNLTDDEKELTRILKEKLIVTASDVIAEETAVEAGLIEPEEDETAMMEEEMMMLGEKVMQLEQVVMQMAQMMAPQQAPPQPQPQPMMAPPMPPPEAMQPPPMPQEPPPPEMMSEEVEEPALAI